METRRTTSSCGRSVAIRLPSVLVLSFFFLLTVVVAVVSVVSASQVKVDVNADVDVGVDVDYNEDGSMKIYYVSARAVGAVDSEEDAPPTAPVSIYGRYYSTGGEIWFDWSGVSIGFQVSGSEVVSIGLQDGGNEYNVFVNGTLETILSTNTSNAVLNYPVRIYI